MNLAGLMHGAAVQKGFFSSMLDFQGFLCVFIYYRSIKWCQRQLLLIKFQSNCSSSSLRIGSGFYKRKQSAQFSFYVSMHLGAGQRSAPACRGNWGRKAARQLMHGFQESFGCWAVSVVQRGCVSALSSPLPQQEWTLGTPTPLSVTGMWKAFDTWHK